MGRERGIAIFAANFEPKKRASLDARGVVDTISELTNLNTWKDSDGNERTYHGMPVVVRNDGANNGLYILLGGTDYSNINNWIKSGSDSLSGMPQLDRFEPITATDVTNGYLDLSQTPTSTMHLDVIRGGAYLDGEGNDYTLSGNRITFVPNILVGGDKVIVKYYY